MQKNFFLICLFLFSQTSFSQENSGNSKRPDSLKYKNNKGLLYSPIETDAEFPGGARKWAEYLKKNINPEIPILNKAPKGVYAVDVMFRIGKDGSITSITPTTQHGYGMEEEFVRVIKESPVWKPAMQNGKPVNAYRKQSIKFRAN
jgi:protein TonB